MQKLSQINFFKYWIIVFSFFLLNLSQAQSDSVLINKDTSTANFYKKKSFLWPSDTFNKKRVHWVVTGMSSTVVLGYTGLYSLWYLGYPSAPFHFFNDIGEWNQIDKTGHVFGAYFETKFMHRIHNWAGISDKKAIIWAGIGAFAIQSTIEVFDGFSAKWGASISDIGANAIGTMLYVGQELAFHKQIVKMKYSFHGSEAINDPNIIQRADNLYGTSAPARLIKDYNGVNAWLSVATSDIFKKQKKAKWFAIAIGYGAGGMYGGFENKWNVKINGVDSVLDYSSIQRYRRVLIAPDIDLEQIYVKRPGWRMLLSMLNLLKFPSPAFEINTKGEIIFYPIYSFGLQYPLYFKK